MKSYLPGTLVQYLVEAGKEGDGCNGRCQNITDRLGEKDAEALIYREAGQDKNHTLFPYTTLFRSNRKSVV